MQKIVSVFVLIAACLSAGAQIAVNVDGHPVAFSGTGALKVNGRVLVPLRGVLEALGAYVEFQSATGTILAQKGNTQIQMKLGDQVAKVNGRNVTLEVPAMSVGGRTMVPLRFVGEAFGADVKWNSATQTVDIKTPGGVVDKGSTVEVTGIDVRYPSEWLKPGDVLQVVMDGTPGAIASFRIPGLVDRVPMSEDSTGVYKGNWTVPKGVNLSGARVLGELSMGDVQRLIQAGGLVNVDSASPKITNVIPEDKSRVATNRLSVSAVFDDGTGSGVSASDVVMKIDGANVTGDATVTGSFITWRPDSALSAGKHNASVTAIDKAGNTATRSWDFTISDATSAVQSFVHDATTKVEPGDTITMTLKGEKNATVTFAIGAKKGIPMRETNPGEYVGEYVVRRGDNLNNASVIATMKTASGETFTVEAEKKINAAITEGDAPKITSHRDGDAVASPVVLKGTATPNSKVHVKVDYATTVIGGIRLTGGLYEVELQANAQGVWETEPVELRLLVNGEDTAYKVTVTLVVTGNDKAPEPTVITLKKK